MEFGIIFPTRIDDSRIICDAEALGYQRAWVPDSQMIWSDCYATLALAARETSRQYKLAPVSRYRVQESRR